MYEEVNNLVKNFDITKTEKYYKGKYKYNDFYEPFKLEEIEKFEKDNNIVFPEEMRKYITEISQSMYKNHLGVRDIPLHEKCIEFMPEIKSLDDNFDENFKIINKIKVYEIRQLGCGFSDNIVLEGEFAGTIWENTLASSGNIELKAKTFYNYILDFNEMKQ